MHILSRKRLCLAPEPIMDEESMLPASAGSVYPHQRGRRRSPAPVPPPHARYDPSAKLFSLAMTSAHPTTAQAPRHARTRRPHTPSGSNGTFRGRRRYRSPSLSMTSSSSATAMRKASTRPHTPSSRSNSLLKSKSISKSKSRQTSPLSPNAGSRSRHARGDSSSPRRVIFRAAVDMDHSVYPYFHHSHHYQHHHAHLHPFSVKKARRAHCPSRPGSVDGTETRRRQRTRSRPRYTRDTLSEIAALSEISHPSHPPQQISHASPNSYINLGSMTDGASDVAVNTISNVNTVNNVCVNPGHTRRQFQMLFTDSSGTNSDGDAMDIEY